MWAGVYHEPPISKGLTALGRVLPGQHLQVVNFAGQLRLRNAIQELPHARLLACAELRGGAVRNDVSLVEQNHTVGDEKRAGKLVSDDDDGDAERLLQFQDEVVAAGGDDRVEAG